jgi:hypothetical protein
MMDKPSKRQRAEQALADAGLTLTPAQVDELCNAIDAMDRLRGLLRAGDPPRHRYAEPAHVFRLEPGAER